MTIFKVFVVEPDLEWEFIDGSIVKAHQHSSGAANEQESGIGKTVAGNTTNIYMAVEAHGLPIHFIIEFAGDFEATNRKRNNRKPYFEGCARTNR